MSEDVKLISDYRCPSCEHELPPSFRCKDCGESCYLCCTCALETEWESAQKAAMEAYERELDRW